MLYKFTTFPSITVTVQIGLLCIFDSIPQNEIQLKGGEFHLQAQHVRLSDIASIQYHTFVYVTTAPYKLKE